MLAQRGGDLVRAPAVARKAAAATAPATAPQEPKPGKQRLSFHKQHALKTLPQRMAALETSIRELQRRLDDPTFYARDRTAFAETSAKLAAAQAELAAAEEQWLELEMLREEIEGP